VLFDGPQEIARRRVRVWRRRPFLDRWLRGGGLPLCLDLLALLYDLVN
jgi:hypothetical protein